MKKIYILIIVFILIAGCTSSKSTYQGSDNNQNVQVTPVQLSHVNIVWSEGYGRETIEKIVIPKDNITCYVIVNPYNDDAGISCIK